jgi:hypothetical protein
LLGQAICTEFWWDVCYKMATSKKNMSTDIKEVGFVMRGIELAQAWFTSVFIALQKHRILF